MPRFSVICIHYQGVIDEPTAVRGLQCLASQSFRDFEVILLHDGPLHRPLELEKVRFPSDISVRVICTETRYNDWGHSLRDIGIREATGDYIVIFNLDNVLYHDALHEMAVESIRAYRPAMLNGVNRNAPDILIFPIWLMGCVPCGRKFFRIKGHELDFRTMLSGFPTVKRNIDCMQLVMRRELWLAEGGWYDKSEESDGEMYQKFADKYGTRYLGRVLGEHW